MDKLNRQQLGSGNWGQSINANGGKIEAGFSQISSSVASLEQLIKDNQFGIAFGGFLRLDKVVEEGGTIVNLGQEAAKLGQIGVTRNAVPASELYTKNAEGQIEHTAAVLAYKVGDISTGEHTDINVPVNRVFRIIGSWNPTTDGDPQGNGVTNTETSAISPYDETLTSGGLLVYTATQFTRLFGNSLIYRPNPVLKGTKIVFEPVEDNETGNVEVPYPSALCESVSQGVKLKSYNQHFVNLPSIGLINGGIEENNGTLVKYTSVKFVTLSNNGNTYEEFSMGHQLKNIGSNEFILEGDTDAILTDNDYAIITYFGSPTVYEDVLGKLNKLNDGSGAVDPNAGSATTGIGE